MVRVSNNLVGILNFVTFVLAIPILAGGIWLSNRASTDCERFLERPVIALGVFLMVVSLAGIVGACCRVSCLLWLYLLVMFILIVLVFCFTVFAFVVTNKGAGEVASGRGYKEYRLGDYSNWLQKRVNSDKNWARIRSCLQDSNVCRSMQQGNETMDQFFRDNLSPIQRRIPPLARSIELFAVYVGWRCGLRIQARVPSHRVFMKRYWKLINMEYKIYFEP